MTWQSFLWATDTHFDHADEAAYEAFVSSIAAHGPIPLVLSGDIADGHTLSTFLLRLLNDTSCPIYFVLGNHDYYGSSVADVRSQVRALCENEERLHYLTRGGIASLSPSVALIGQDGWADGRCGDYDRSSIVLNDCYHIRELMGRSKEERLSIQQQFADEGAYQLDQDLDRAAAEHSHIIAVTHLPPFRAACLYEDSPADDNWAPHFVCQAIGATILKHAVEHPETQYLVLCGHSHHTANVEILPNLRVLCGAAEYGNPQLQDPLSI